MEIQSEAGLVLFAGTVVYAPVKNYLGKLARLLKSGRSSPAIPLSQLNVDEKTALLETLIAELMDHNVDRHFHNTVRRVSDERGVGMPGDLEDTSHGQSVVMDLSGNRLGPFCTQATADLVRTCVLNPHLVAPGTNSDFADLRIRRNSAGPHQFTVSNGVQSLFEVDDAPLAVWARDYVALALAKIALGFDAGPDDLLATARDYMNSPSHLRARGMVAFPSQGGSHVWTGFRWRILPLGANWVALYRAVCADMSVLETDVNFSRASNGMLTAEYDGEVLSRLNDTPEGRNLLTEALQTVHDIAREVRDNGGIEGLSPPPAPSEAVPERVEAVLALETADIARPSLVLALLRAVEPSVFAADRENSVFAVADHIQGLERRIANLEEALKGASTPPAPEIEGPNGDQVRRRAIRA